MPSQRLCDPVYSLCRVSNTFEFIIINIIKGIQYFWFAGIEIKCWTIKLPRQRTRFTICMVRRHQMRETRESAEQQ